MIKNLYSPWVQSRFTRFYDYCELYGGCVCDNPMLQNLEDFSGPATPFSVTFTNIFEMKFSGL